MVLLQSSGLMKTVAVTKKSVEMIWTHPHGRGLGLTKKFLLPPPLYGGIDKKNDGILISRLGVQKQLGTADCGAFALAFAFHVLPGEIMLKI